MLTNIVAVLMTICNRKNSERGCFFKQLRLQMNFLSIFGC